MASHTEKPPAVSHYRVAGSTLLWGPCGSLHVAPVLVPITVSENRRWTQDRIWENFLSITTCGWFRVYDQELVRRCMHVRNPLRRKTLSAICALSTQPVSSSGSRNYEKSMQGRLFVSVPCHPIARQALNDWWEPALSCTMPERTRVLDYRPVDGLLLYNIRTSVFISLGSASGLAKYCSHVLHARWKWRGSVWTDAGSLPVLAENNTGPQFAFFFLVPSQWQSRAWTRMSRIRTF